MCTRTGGLCHLYYSCKENAATTSFSTRQLETELETVVSIHSRCRAPPPIKGRRNSLPRIKSTAMKWINHQWGTIEAKLSFSNLFKIEGITQGWRPIVNLSNASSQATLTACRSNDISYFHQLPAIPQVFLSIEPTWRSLLVFSIPMEITAATAGKLQPTQKGAPT